MSVLNCKFIYKNVLGAAEQSIPIDIMFSDSLVKMIEAWQPVLRMDSSSSAIALFNIIATTLKSSSVTRSSDDRHNVPLNFYNMILARSSYGKSDITKLIRSVLDSICIAHEQSTDLCLDEFTPAGLKDCLQQCTKIFMADDADMTFVDAGLFNGFPKPSAEANCRSLVMTLFDRMSSPYVQGLTKKSVAVENSKLNLLGLSTGELVGTIVSRFKAGGSLDPMIGRFSWWVLDGPPILEPIVEPILDRSIPSIEQFAFACSMINNCNFKYDDDAWLRIVEWGNSMRQESYDYREDELFSSILGKSIQHVHRYAAFMQTMEFGYNICTVYLERFKEFPSSGIIDEHFVEHLEQIFNEIFCDQVNVDKQRCQFKISDQVAFRAINLISGLLLQMKILMDDTNAPIWNANQVRPASVLSVNNEWKFKGRKGSKKKTYVGYVSTARFERIAVEILLFPSLCFTKTQLHRNSFIHNASLKDLCLALEHLVKSKLLVCVKRGIKTSRKCTRVYIKQLPACDSDGNVNFNQNLSFKEKLNAFTNHHSDLTIEKYLNKKNMAISLDAIGVVTNELMEVLSLPEYMNIDLSQLYNLKSRKTKQINMNQSNVNVQKEVTQKDHSPATNTSPETMLQDDADDVSDFIDSVINEIEMSGEETSFGIGSEFGSDLLLTDEEINSNRVNIDQEVDDLSNDNINDVAHGEVNNDAISNISTTIMELEMNDNIKIDNSKIKHRKRKSIEEQQSNNHSDLTCWSPLPWNLRSKKFCY